MKLLILFSTILLALTQNNLLVDACLPIDELLVALNADTPIPLDIFLQKFQADSITEEGFHQLHKCFSSLTVVEKTKHFSLEEGICPPQENSKRRFQKVRSVTVAIDIPTGKFPVSHGKIITSHEQTKIALSPECI